MGARNSWAEAVTTIAPKIAILNVFMFCPFVPGVQFLA
jgi:hypothetical protein